MLDELKFYTILGVALLGCLVALKAQSDELDRVFEIREQQLEVRE